MTLVNVTVNCNSCPGEVSPSGSTLSEHLQDIWLFGDIWPGAPNMAKWGIPEKSIKNAAQRR